MNDGEVISRIASAGTALDASAAAEQVARTCPAPAFSGKRLLMVVPDLTRSAPVGWFFKAAFQQWETTASTIDVLFALGTHRHMTEAEFCRRLEISVEERASTYGKVRFFNHEWDNPRALHHLGTISAEEIRQLTEGQFSMEVPVTVNRRIFDYDHLVVIGPVFPHEVVGFSGGNKYFFPGISGPEVLHFFHWLGAVVTNPGIIGYRHTPVRRVIDRAAAMIPVEKSCFCLVLDAAKRLVGIFSGRPEPAWESASAMSGQHNIVWVDRPFHTVLSCVSAMYDELWTAGKGMYKLEPVVADGGELIIYGPHVTAISHMHGTILEKIGYHCRDYFLHQWKQFQHFPWGILAHSSHVRGVGTFVNGVETPRIRVTLATGIPPETCRQIQLDYRDPATIHPESFAHRESEGILLVPDAGETLYRVRQNSPATPALLSDSAPSQGG